MRKVRPHVSKLLWVGLTIFCFDAYFLKCRGPFLDYSDLQSVSPDGRVKAILIHGGTGSRISAPFDLLELEQSDWNSKPADAAAVTDGEFLTLTWVSNNQLIITGTHLEKALLEKPKIIKMRDGRFEVFFKEVIPKKAQ